MTPNEWYLCHIWCIRFTTVHVNMKRVPKLTTNHHLSPLFHEIEIFIHYIWKTKTKYACVKQLLMVAGAIDDILSGNIYLYLYLWQPLLLPIWWQHPERETFPFCVFIRSHLQMTGTSIRFDTEKRNHFYTYWQFNASTWYWLQTFDTIRHREKFECCIFECRI